MSSSSSISDDGSCGCGTLFAGLDADLDDADLVDVPLDVDGLDADAAGLEALDGLAAGVAGLDADLVGLGADVGVLGLATLAGVGVGVAGFLLAALPLLACFFCTGAGVSSFSSAGFRFLVRVCCLDDMGVEKLNTRGSCMYVGGGLLVWCGVVWCGVAWWWRGGGVVWRGVACMWGGDACVCACVYACGLCI